MARKGKKVKEWSDMFLTEELVGNSKKITLMLSKEKEFPSLDLRKIKFQILKLLSTHNILMILSLLEQFLNL